jgi:hypothetical protein
MSIVARGLQQGIVSHGLGGVTLGPDEEIVELDILAIAVYEKKEYPTTGTFNEVEGWQWSKSLAQDLSKERQRINSHIGGYENNLEEGTIYQDWIGAKLNGLEVSIVEKQDKTKRSKWLAEIDPGQYSILHKKNYLYGNKSSSLILNDELFYELDELVKSNLTISTYKRDSFFNNIPNIVYQYDDNLDLEFSYTYDDQNNVLLNQLYKKEIGVGEELDSGSWEFCGVSTETRSIIYTEYFPAINLRLIEKTIEGNLIEWSKVNKFSNENRREFIVDEHSGKIFINSKTDKKFYVKKDFGNAIEIYGTTDSLKESGTFNNRFSYYSKTKTKILLNENRASVYNKGDVITFNKEGNNFQNGSELYISYTNVPRLSYEIAEEKRTSNFNLKPYELGTSIGLIEIAPYEKTLSKINLTSDLTKIGNDLYQTLKVGSDSTIIEAEALNYKNKPVKEINISFYTDNGLFENTSKTINQITSELGTCLTSYSQPYENDVLAEYVNIEYEGNNSVIELNTITPGTNVNDINIFQVLKTDPYYGSLGTMCEIESFELKNGKYHIILKEKLLDSEEYITYQNYDFNDIAERFPLLCQEGYINFGWGYFYFNNSLVSSKALIENIIEDKCIVVDPANFENVFFTEINQVRLFKRNELLFNIDSIKQTGRSFDRICYYSNGEEYVLLRPDRLEGRKLIFENIHIPQASASSVTNIIGAYKVFNKKINKVWAEAVDPATGRIIRSNTLKIIVDFPAYLKGNQGFKLKQDLDIDESGLGGSNFITINPLIQNQINFMI